MYSIKLIRNCKKSHQSRKQCFELEWVKRPLCYSRTSEANGRNSSKQTGPIVGLSKTLKNVKTSKKYSSMDNFTDRMNFRSHFCIRFRLLLHHKNQGCSLFYPLALYCEKQPKMTIYMRAERSNATPIKPVDFYDLKYMSFKFGNDIFINFEIPGSSFWKNNISLLFCPFALEVLGLLHLTAHYRTVSSQCLLFQLKLGKISN